MNGLIIEVMHWEICLENKYKDLFIIMDKFLSLILVQQFSKTYIHLLVINTNTYGILKVIGKQDH